MAAKPPTIGLVSLGCPKALVDSERIITDLRAQGYVFSQDYEGADAVIVNTCGFLDSAKQESLEAIGEAIDENGKVIVTGCLGTEADVIKQAFPQVLAVSGPQQYDAVVGAVHDVAPPLHDPRYDLVPPGGLKLTPRHYAYLKISEGCNNSCRFCIIPDIRGPLTSRPVASVLYEAERLVSSGVKELLVISQDTSAYGVDIKYATSPFHGRDVSARFVELARELGQIAPWVRFHYVYPYPHVDAVVELMADGHVLPYLDIPFQHASPDVLKKMRRPGDTDKVLRRIEKWREVCPDLTLRSTFIVGHPGESEADFELLLDFLEEAKISRAGCFQYEPVDGAQSNALPDHVPDEVSQSRWDRFMAKQREISSGLLAEKVGSRQTVLIDAVNEAENTATARTNGDAPEVDGVVEIAGGGELVTGSFVDVRITGSDDYDLTGEIA